MGERPWIREHQATIRNGIILTRVRSRGAVSRPSTGDLIFALPQIGAGLDCTYQQPWTIFEALWVHFADCRTSKTWRSRVYRVVIAGRTLLCSWMPGLLQADDAQVNLPVNVCRVFPVRVVE